MQKFLADIRISCIYAKSWTFGQFPSAYPNHGTNTAEVKQWPKTIKHKKDEHDLIINWNLNTKCLLPKHLTGFSQWNKSRRNVINPIALLVCSLFSQKLQTTADNGREQRLNWTA